MTAEPTAPADRATSDAGFTLTEVVIVVFLLGIIMPVLAMAFTVVIRTTPTSEDRADDSRALLNLTNWLSQDVSSTAEDGFYIGTSAPSGGCLASSLPASSINLLELHWSEGTENYVSNYRFVETDASTGRIYRYACQQGQAGVERHDGGHPHADGGHAHVRRRLLRTNRRVVDRTRVEVLIEPLE